MIINQPDCVAVFRYGYRSPTDPGPTNLALARTTISRHGDTPVVTSQQMAYAFSAQYGRHEDIDDVRIIDVGDGKRPFLQNFQTPTPGVLQVINFHQPFRKESVIWKQRLPRDEGASPWLVRHDTVEFMSQVLALAETMGWRSILPVAVRHQVRRIDHLAHWLGRSEAGDVPYFLAAEGVALNMDRRSKEGWTRSGPIATAYESSITALSALTLGRDSLG